MPRKKKFKNTKTYKFLAKSWNIIKKICLISICVWLLFLWVYPQLGNIKNTDVLVVYGNQKTYTEWSILSLKSRLDIAANYYQNDYSDYVILIAFQDYEQQKMKEYIASKWVWEGDIIVLDSAKNITDSISEIKKVTSIKWWNSIHFISPYYETYFIKKQLQGIPRTEVSFSNSQRFYSFDNILSIFSTIKDILIHI